MRYLREHDIRVLEVNQPHAHTPGDDDDPDDDEEVTVTIAGAGGSTAARR